MGLLESAIGGVLGQVFGGQKQVDKEETLLKELKQCRKMIKDNPDDGE